MDPHYSGIFFLVYRFPNNSLPKSSWASTLQVVCGWGKSWSPPAVTGCVDPRGCIAPPSRTPEVWGSFEDSPTKLLDVGVSYWYSCRAGLFALGANNYSSFIDMKCVNDENGGPPFWSPAFDNVINPFPPCVNLRKYFGNIGKYLRMLCILTSLCVLCTSESRSKYFFALFRNFYYFLTFLFFFV